MTTRVVGGRRERRHVRAAAGRQGETTLTIVSE